MAADFVRYCVQLNMLSIPRLKVETGYEFDSCCADWNVKLAMRYVRHRHLTYDQIANVLIGQELTSPWATKPQLKALPRVLKYLAHATLSTRD